MIRGSDGNESGEDIGDNSLAGRSSAVADEDRSFDGITLASAADSPSGILLLRSSVDDLVLDGDSSNLACVVA